MLDSWEAIVESWGYEVIALERFGTYQGDVAAVLRNGPSVGIIVIGYGSCSGCDALEAVLPWSEDGDWLDAHALSEQVKNDVTWFDNPETAAVWIETNSPNRWWINEEPIKQWMLQILPRS